MASREDFGSWLDGSPSGDVGGRDDRLGLPATGPGSFAPVTLRLAALVVDWLLCMLVGYLLFDGAPLATLAIFAVENLVLVSTVGSTVGHRIFGLRVRTEGREALMIGFLLGAIRTVLLVLVVPAAIWDADGRGMHDKAARTIIVRSR
ncbi:RDD family protein [Sanguibacter sp. 25GB23B1]|uniref:RDD family protein n=1 Tax=unclassified Sanguibacter TaxID=2645534 RepID=UPI0032AF6382